MQLIKLSGCNTPEAHPANGGKMKALTNIIRRIDMVCGVLAESVVFLLMLLVTAEILGRRLFGSPIPGQVEAATLSLVIVLYLGVAYAQWKENHIRVDIFISRVKGRKRELLEALTLFLSLIPTVLMLWATAERARGSIAGGEFVSGVIEFPVWPGRCAVVFGLAILSLTLAVQLCNHLAAAFHFGKNGMEK